MNGICHGTPLRGMEQQYADLPQQPPDTGTPLEEALIRLASLQQRVFLSRRPCHGSDQVSQKGSSTLHNYYNSACELLATSVSAAEICAAELLRGPTSCLAALGPPAADGYAADADKPHTLLTACKSVAESRRWLCALVASLRLTDCLKDAKADMRRVVCRTAPEDLGIHDVEGQQLLSTVQSFMESSNAAVKLLRDLLLEDASALPRARVSVQELLAHQLRAATQQQDASRVGRGGIDGGSRKPSVGATTGGAAKARSGASSIEQTLGSDGGGGAGGGSSRERSESCIALSVLVYLGCALEGGEKANDAQRESEGTAGPNAPAAKSSGAAEAHKLMQSCMAVLRATPVVPGMWDVPVDLLEPLKGLDQQPASLDLRVVATPGDAAVVEDGYTISALVAAAAQDYGEVMEQLLALKLRHAGLRDVEDAHAAAGGTRAAGAAAADERPARAGAHHEALSADAAAAASQSLRLLQDWQSALLSLDAWRLWQQQQRKQRERDSQAQVHEDDLEAEGQDQGQKTQPRCAFTSAEAADCVRLLSYTKGLQSFLRDCMPWLAPLLQAHARAQLAALLRTAVLPMAQGTLLGQLLVTPQASYDAGHSDRGGYSQFTGNAASTMVSNASTAAVGQPPASQPAVDSAAAKDKDRLALGIGKLWRARAAAHKSPTAAGDEQQPAAGPDERTPAPGCSSNSTGTPGPDDCQSCDFTPDPFTRLRDWFASDRGNNPGMGLSLEGPLMPVPEGHTPRSNGSDAEAASQATRSLGMDGQKPPYLSADYGGVQSPSNHSLCRAASPAPSGQRSRLAPRGGSQVQQTTDDTDDGEAALECSLSTINSGAVGVRTPYPEQDEQQSAYSPPHAEQPYAAAPWQPPVGPAGQPSSNYLAQYMAAEQASQLSWLPAAPQDPYSAQSPSPFELELHHKLAATDWASSTGPGPVAEGTMDASMDPRQAAALARLTGPASLNTNPLFLHGSVFAQVASESQGGAPPDANDHAAVGIWMCSEGGTGPATTTSNPPEEHAYHQQPQPQEDKQGLTGDAAEAKRKGLGKFKTIKKLFGVSKRSLSAAGQGEAAQEDTRRSPGGNLADVRYSSMPGAYGGPGVSMPGGGWQEAAGGDFATAYPGGMPPLGPAPWQASPSKSVYASGQGIADGWHQGPVFDGEQLVQTARQEGAVAVVSIGSGQQDTGAGEQGAWKQWAAGADGGDTRASGGWGRALQSLGGRPMGASQKGPSFAAVVRAAAEANATSSRLKLLSQAAHGLLAEVGVTCDDACAQAEGNDVARRAGQGVKGGRTLKKLMTSFKAMGMRKGSGPGDARDVDQQAYAAPVHGQDASTDEPSLSMDGSQLRLLRRAVELMEEELVALVVVVQKLGKDKGGPSPSQLLSTATGLQAFLRTTWPQLVQLLQFEELVFSAADFSSLALRDPAALAAACSPADTADADLGCALATGSIPWELVRVGVLGLDSEPPAEGQRRTSAAGPRLPLDTATTVLSLYKDAYDYLQGCGEVVEPACREQHQEALCEQARWCIGEFVKHASAAAWATYKAHAIQSELGSRLPPAVPGVAQSTAMFKGVFRQNGPEALAGHRLRAPVWRELQVSVLARVRASAQRLAAELLGADLMGVAAAEQQLNVLAAAVANLRRDLQLPPWSDVWSQALAEKAAASPTCGEAVRSASSASEQTGAALSSEDIISLHVCSPAVLRSIDSWSYDVAAMQFQASKHTVAYWASVCGAEGGSSGSAAEGALQDAVDAELKRLAERQPGGSDAWAGTEGPSRRLACAAPQRQAFGACHVVALYALVGLEGVGSLVAELRRHAVRAFTESATLLRTVHELYDSGPAGPGGPGLRGAGGPSGFLQLQQRWLRERRHSDMLVAAHRAMQAIGNAVALVGLLDGVLAGLSASRVAPHLLPLLASAVQADQQAHAALQSMSAGFSSGGGASGLVLGSIGSPTSLVVPPPPPGTGLAGLLLGSPLPPGLVTAGSQPQAAVAAAALLQERMGQELPAAHGLPGLWRALCLAAQQLAPSAGSSGSGVGPGNAWGANAPPSGTTRLSAARLWCVLQVQLCCLTEEEQQLHAANIGDGVYVAAAALLQLEAGQAHAPCAVLLNDTTANLLGAAGMELMRAAVTAAATAVDPRGVTPVGAAARAAVTEASNAAAESQVLQILKAWVVRAEYVRAKWDVAVQQTATAGRAAPKLAVERERAGPGGSLVEPAPLTCRSGAPWGILAQQAAAAGSSMAAWAACVATAGAPPAAGGGHGGAPQPLAPSAPPPPPQLQLPPHALQQQQQAAAARGAASSLAGGDRSSAPNLARYSTGPQPTGVSAERAPGQSAAGYSADPRAMSGAGYSSVVLPDSNRMGPQPWGAISSGPGGPTSQPGSTMGAQQYAMPQRGAYTGGGIGSATVEPNSVSGLIPGPFGGAPAGAPPALHRTQSHSVAAMREAGARLQGMPSSGGDGRASRGPAGDSWGGAAGTVPPAVYREGGSPRAFMTVPQQGVMGSTVAEW